VYVQVGYIVLPGRLTFQECTLRRVRGFVYWVGLGRLPYHLNGFESTCWDAAIAAVVRSVPLTLRPDRLWETSYKYNQKYYNPN
jgi:hypothetical protein